MRPDDNGSVLLSIDTCGDLGGVVLGWEVDPECGGGGCLGFPHQSQNQDVEHPALLQPVPVSKLNIGGFAEEPWVSLANLEHSDSESTETTEDNPRLFYRELPGRTFSERLLPSVSDLLIKAGIQLKALAGIVVVAGPGSFTGIRIGISAAKGLAEGLRLPVIAVSRLELLARKVAASDGIAVLDAGRDEFFVGVHRAGGSEVEVLATRDGLQALVADSVASLNSMPRLLVCEPRVYSALTDLGAELVTAPTAVDAWKVGMQRFRRAQFDDVASLDANYLRRSETEMLARIAEHVALKAAGRDSLRG
jgi:tRNA threonylcarbamoyladenosine biosynthesis protein TsaB